MHTKLLPQGILQIFDNNRIVGKLDFSKGKLTFIGKLRINAKILVSCMDLIDGRELDGEPTRILFTKDRIEFFLGAPPSLVALASFGETLEVYGMDSSAKLLFEEVYKLLQPKQHKSICTAGNNIRFYTQDGVLLGTIDLKHKSFDGNRAEVLAVLDSLKATVKSGE